MIFVHLGLMPNPVRIWWEYLDTGYGCGTMGLFILTHECTRDDWNTQLGYVQAFVDTMAGLIKDFGPEAMAFEGAAIVQLHLAQFLVPRLATLADSFRPQDLPENYAKLNDDIDQWFTAFFDPEQS
jgi:hypothetical protein